MSNPIIPLPGIRMTVPGHAFATLGLFVALVRNRPKMFWAKENGDFVPMVSADEVVDLQGLSRKVANCHPFATLKWLIHGTPPNFEFSTGRKLLPVGQWRSLVRRNPGLAAGLGADLILHKVKPKKKKNKKGEESKEEVLPTEPILYADRSPLILNKRNAGIHKMLMLHTARAEKEGTAGVLSFLDGTIRLSLVDTPLHAFGLYPDREIGTAYRMFDPMDVPSAGMLLFMLALELFPCFLTGQWRPRMSAPGLVPRKRKFYLPVTDRPVSREVYESLLAHPWLPNFPKPGRRAWSRLGVAGVMQYRLENVTPFAGPLGRSMVFLEGVEV